MGRRGTSWLTTLVNVVIFIVLEMAAFSMVRHNAPLQRFWAARAAHATMGRIWSGTSSIGNYFSLRSENEALAQENFNLHAELLEAREALREAKLETPSKIKGFSVLSAEVVQISQNGQHNYLVLNKGLEDGVQVNSGIITRNGVAGIVDAVSDHFAFAFSFQNNDVSVSARLGREGGGGLLVWDGSSEQGAVLTGIPLQFKYEKGDTVYTSGHSLVFPPDIPLGTLTGKARVVNGATNELGVTLFQSFSDIRYVTVVHNNSIDEIQKLTSP
ncbi:MAG: rod shape-determining protein MreC [Bacteroidales bacterium]|nr:rod shape-determining protein MreC [Bacteroidales bacterium]